MMANTELRGEWLVGGKAMVLNNQNWWWLKAHCKGTDLVRHCHWLSPLVIPWCNSSNAEESPRITESKPRWRSRPTMAHCDHPTCGKLWVPAGQCGGHIGQQPRLSRHKTVSELANKAYIHGSCLVDTDSGYHFLIHDYANMPWSWDGHQPTHDSGFYESITLFFSKSHITTCAIYLHFTFRIPNL